MDGTDQLLDLEDLDLFDEDFFDEGDILEVYEDEYEDEYENYNGEDGFDGEADWESAPPLADVDPFAEWESYESEWETIRGEPDLEGDFEDYELYESFDLFDEDDEFFKKIGRFVKRAARSVGRLVKKGVQVIGKFAGPLLKVLGPVAAKIVGGAIGGPAGVAIAGTLTSALLKEAEDEDEGDAEAEIEEDEALLEGIGIDEAAYDLMAEAAYEMSANEDEAGSNRALIRMVAHGVRAFRRNRRLRPYIPRVMRAAIALARTFRGNRKTRWAVRVIPLIVARTMLRLASTRRITRRTLVEAMARETAWVLASRRRANAAMAAMQRRRRFAGRRRRTRRRRTR